MLCHNLYMPRQARISVADVVYHVINRSNGRVPIFYTDKDYKHFESLLQEAKDLTDMRILSYCIMPNHWHLVLYPRTDTNLTEFMGWLTSTHVRQYRTRTNTIGYGHLYQDRYKSFPAEANEYCQTLIRPAPESRSSELITSSGVPVFGVKKDDSSGVPVFGVKKGERVKHNQLRSPGLRS